MAKDKLVIEPDKGFGGSYRYRMWWWLAEDDDLGACIGQGKLWLNILEPKERDEWECWIVEKTLLDTGVDHDTSGFYWETETQARVALKLANEAIKQDRALPEWAKTALAQGWKPPKGWKA